MCGRVYSRRPLAEMVAEFSFASPGDISALANAFPRWNGAPRQDYPIIVVDELAKGTTIFKSASWGLIPTWMKEAKGGPRPINAKSETVKTNGLFRSAYRTSRALMPIDGYFEWKDILGTGKNKQPYAIAMKSGEPFALAALWSEWTHPETKELLSTFAVLTCAPNAMMATIHDRMPVILHPQDYKRWLFDEDPEDLMRPFPDELMTMWPIGRDVGNVRNNRPDLLDPIDRDFTD